MATSFGALCNDFYINMKVSLKMDLPSDRETILHLFDRVRKSVPDMSNFRRYDGELALESTRREAEYQWLALRQNSIRSGHVNPESMAEGYKLHELILDIAPYHLTISPLDVDYFELLFGFDLECKGNHDQVVADALFTDTPLSPLVHLPDGKLVDVQPVFGYSLTDNGDRQCHIEVKTRRRGRRGASGKYRNEPISIFLTLRQYGPFDKIEDFKPAFENLASQADGIAVDTVVPHVLTPIARHITSSSP